MTSAAYHRRAAARLGGAAASLAVALASLAAGNASAAEAGLPQLNVHTYVPQLFWLAVTFVILYVLMSKVALPKIGEVVEGRRQKLDGDLAAAERFRKDSEKALADYEKALADARAKAQGLANETRAKAQGLANEQRSRLDAELNQQVRSAETRINESRVKALAGLSDVAVEVVGEVVGRIGGSAPQADELKSAVASAIAARRG